MPYALDPELVPVMEALAERSRDTPRPRRGDWQTLRDIGNAGQAYLATLVPPSRGVHTRTFAATAADGVSLELRWYTKDAVGPGSAVVYAHGGGMILGSLDLYDELMSYYVDQTGVPFLAVAYRLAPEVNAPTLAEDVYSAISWLIEHAGELGVDRSRIAVMGDSGGGAPAAGAAILARERNVFLAKQILVYPMLDDRQPDRDPALEPFLTWTYDDNFTAWSTALGGAYGTDDIAPTAAPARLTDFRRLPATYIDVGDLDILRDEALACAQRLAGARVPVEVHVHPGVPHGWERFAPKSQVALRAIADRIRAITAL
jgi:acetyl esterase/lipase